MLDGCHLDLIGPSLVEWCSTCTSTRLVRLELPEEKKEVLEPVADKEEEIVAVCKVEEEDSSCEATAKDAFTQTPRRRRRGGRDFWLSSLC